MIITNLFNLPQPLVSAMMFDDYSRGDAAASVTQIISAPRLEILRRKHDDEITIDITELIFLLLGKGVHKLLEGFGDFENIPEERLFHEYAGWRISGQIDVQVVSKNQVCLIDWKVCSTYAVQSQKSDWENQLNVYADLIEKCTDYKVVGVHIVAILRDWRKAMAQTRKDYPQAQAVRIPYRIWPPDVRQAYIEERVRLHQDVRALDEWGDDLPECSMEERWQRPPDYAVYSVTPTKYALKKKDAMRAHIVSESREELDEKVKDDPELIVEVRPGAESKNAVAVKDNEADAKAFGEKLGKDFIIRARDHKPIRCVDWCSVNKWCDQYHRWVAENGESENGDEEG